MPSAGSGAGEMTDEVEDTEDERDETPGVDEGMKEESRVGETKEEEARVEDSTDQRPTSDEGVKHDGGGDAIWLPAG